MNCDPLIPRDDGKKLKSPRHQDLSRELRLISEELADGYNRVLAAVDAVWLCKNVTEVCDSLCKNIEKPGVAIRAERALKVAKWLFIEQDITDWNTSGRGMLMSGIQSELGR